MKQKGKGIWVEVGWVVCNKIFADLVYILVIMVTVVMMTEK